MNNLGKEGKPKYESLFYKQKPSSPNQQSTKVQVETIFHCSGIKLKKTIKKEAWLSRKSYKYYFHNGAMYLCEPHPSHFYQK